MKTDPAALFDLRGRVAIVTGASSGLGVAFARGLVAAGAHVVLAARRVERLDALAAELEQAGGQALAVGCDVVRESDVERLVAAAQERFGRIDVLVNNAGSVHVGPAEDEPLARFREIVDVNLMGAFSCAQRVGRVMLAAGRGSIVNVASVLGLVASGQVKQTSYCASKGAVVNLTRELGAQWARRGVRVNAIAPGWFESEMTADMFADPKSVQWMRSRDPMGRAGRDEELIGPLLFLASDASSYVTGQTLAVDGGWTII
jgi:NAD(P)-dependent dehydrogenase (short-subunit alcohol dehydrogenase family)